MNLRKINQYLSENSEIRGFILSLHDKNVDTLPSFDYSPTKVLKHVLKRLGMKKIIKRNNISVCYPKMYSVFLFFEEIMSDLFNVSPSYFCDLVKHLEQSEQINILRNKRVLTPLIAICMEQRIQTVSVNDLLIEDKNQTTQTYKNFMVFLKCASLDYESATKILNKLNYNRLCSMIVHSKYKEMRAYIKELNYYFPQFNSLAHLIQSGPNKHYEDKSIDFLNDPLKIPIKFRALPYFKASIEYLQNKTGYKLENDKRLVLIYFIEAYQKRWKKDIKHVGKLYNFVECVVKEDVMILKILILRGFFHEAYHHILEREFRTILGWYKKDEENLYLSRIVNGYFGEKIREPS